MSKEDEKNQVASNRDKVINIAAMIVAAEVQNGNRTHYISEWSDTRLDKITNAAVKMATLIIKKTEHIK